VICPAGVPYKGDFVLRGTQGSGRSGSQTRNSDFFQAA
jgi:hypothetical protein